MYVLDASVLKLGDIVFTRDRHSWSSRAVRFASLSRYSHEMLYVDSHSYIDSDADGVHANNLQRKLFESAEDVAV